MKVPPARNSRMVTADGPLVASCQAIHISRRCRMVARVTTSQRSDADEAKLFIEDYAIPSLREVPGFMGAYFLADREKGTGISITFWKAEGATRATEIAAGAG